MGQVPRKFGASRHCFGLSMSGTLTFDSETLQRLADAGLSPARLPGHVAIIMDGNGRWARGRGLPRIEGHRRGKEAVRAVVETARRLGIPYLSLYAFSTENWSRPREEVNGLMSLLRRYLATELRKMMRNQIRLL